jgi:hypothetical protein
MSINAKLTLAFADNKAAQHFSGWLHHEGYDNKSLSGNILTVTVFAHGDRVVIMEEARERNGKIITNEVTDDDN